MEYGLTFQESPPSKGVAVDDGRVVYGWYHARWNQRFQLVEWPAILPASNPGEAPRAVLIKPGSHCVNTGAIVKLSDGSQHEIWSGEEFSLLPVVDALAARLATEGKPVHVSETIAAFFGMPFADVGGAGKVYQVSVARGGVHLLERSGAYRMPGDRALPLMRYLDFFDRYLGNPRIDQ